MTRPVITEITAPALWQPGHPSLLQVVQGEFYVYGTGTSGDTVRIYVDGSSEPSRFDPGAVSESGRWIADNTYGDGYAGSRALSEGLHSLVASTALSSPTNAPQQTSDPVVLLVGSERLETLQGPVLSTSITGPSYMFGYAGDDRFIGYTVANDLSSNHAKGATVSIDGGADLAFYTDTVVLPVALSDGVTSVLRHPSNVAFSIATPDATINFLRIEKLAFTDLTITVQASVLNDFLYYDSRYRDLAIADVNAQQHYETSGWREGRDPNAFFSTTGYLASNADVAAAGINPLAHYDAVGWKEGRDPSAAFDTSLYLRFNPDVAASSIDPLTHYLAIGRGEGRKTSPVVDSANLSATGFDPTYYKLANPDVARAGVDLQQHYLSIGFQEGRNPDAFFDTLAYRRANPDVAAAGLNPLLHYMSQGWREGRDPSSHFDTWRPTRTWLPPASTRWSTSCSPASRKGAPPTATCSNGRRVPRLAAQRPSGRQLRIAVAA
jgi:hypothetical protein